MVTFGRHRMLVVVGVALGMLCSAAVALVVVGCVAVIYRRWKGGLLRIAAGVVGGLVVVVGLGLGGRFLIPAEVWAADVGPELRARALGKNISQLMNVAVFGVPFGLVAGIVAAWRKRTDLRTR